MESFFSSLNTERIVKKVYRTMEQVKADVFDYIECSTTRPGVTRPKVTSVLLTSTIARMNLSRCPPNRQQANSADRPFTYHERGTTARSIAPVTACPVR